MTVKNRRVMGPLSRSYQSESFGSFVYPFCLSAIHDLQVLELINGRPLAMILTVISSALSLLGSFDLSRSYASNGVNDLGKSPEHA
jgi:hypothetical protein